MKEVRLSRTWALLIIHRLRESEERKPPSVAPRLGGGRVLLAISERWPIVGEGDGLVTLGTRTLDDPAAERLLLHHR